MAEYTVQTIGRSGLDISDAELTAVSASDTFENDGSTFLLVKNGSGGSLTVTFTITETVDGQSVTDRTLAVADGEIYLAGPFPKGQYNDSNGDVTVGYSATTSVKALAMKLGS